jgi:hypothetical protein
VGHHVDGKLAVDPASRGSRTGFGDSGLQWRDTPREVTEALLTSVPDDDVLEAVRSFHAGQGDAQIANGRSAQDLSGHTFLEWKVPRGRRPCPNLLLEPNPA